MQKEFGELSPKFTGFLICILSYISKVRSNSFLLNLAVISFFVVYIFLKKDNHTFEFSEHVSMFQTSSSAIESVTLNFFTR